MLTYCLQTTEDEKCENVILYWLKICCSPWQNERRSNSYENYWICTTKSRTGGLEKHYKI